VTSEDPDVQAVARVGAVPSILKVISQSTGLRLALVARVTDEIWKACAVLDRMDFGLAPGGELELTTTLCHEVHVKKTPIVIEHASADPLYRDHATPKTYGFESYISVPIIMRSGAYFGNLCALDVQPAQLKSGETLAMFELFAELIGLQLETEEKLRSTEVALLDAEQTAALREHFIAVLGHDLRTPLSAIATGAEILRRRELGAAELKIVERMRRSVQRMSDMIADTLDFARGRLGGGIPLERANVADLDRAFAHVIEEARAAHPGREVRYEVDAAKEVYCDRGRLAQLLANLLGNALEHSPAHTSVYVAVSFAQDELTVAVTNQGEPIPASTRTQLFRPFVRRASARPRAGLGLGLYIVSEIAASHGGRVELSSVTGGTTFRFVMPIGSRA
jgi:phosphoserine phosphatase RsbU/P